MDKLVADGCRENGMAITEQGQRTSGYRSLLTRVYGLVSLFS